MDLVGASLRDDLPRAGQGVGDRHLERQRHQPARLEVQLIPTIDRPFTQNLRFLKLGFLQRVRVRTMTSSCTTLSSRVSKGHRLRDGRSRSAPIHGADLRENRMTGSRSSSPSRRITRAACSCFMRCATLASLVAKEAGDDRKSAITPSPSTPQVRLRRKPDDEPWRLGWRQGSTATHSPPTKTCSGPLDARACR